MSWAAQELLVPRRLAAFAIKTVIRVAAAVATRTEDLPKGREAITRSERRIAAQLLPDSFLGGGELLEDWI